MDQAAGHESSSSQGEPAAYAFLNHSTNTLVNKLPPDVDNKPLARQKRKRTSPEDQAVLEAAYLRDPKPDKEARLRLVEQIALGEKEVQIWFQNRRQTSRRKSRPLLPHEIAQFQMSRYGTMQLECPNSDETQHFDEQVADNSASQSSEVSETSPEVPQSSQTVATESFDVELPILPSISALHQQGSSVDYLANRRSLPSLSQVLDNLGGSSQAPAPSESSTQVLRKSTSFVRLSMTSEGAAKLVTKDSLTPSPPRPAESQQASNDTREASPSRQQARQVSSLKRSASGRSRDSRAWEFWCDKDSRLELEQKAEKDGKGSAADAIGTIRAASRKALQPISIKQTSAHSKHHPWRVRTDVKRPSMQRSQTSAGRLQHAGNVVGHVKRKRVDKPGALTSSLSVYIPGNESDKENWTPGDGPGSFGKKSSMPTKIKPFDAKDDSENVVPEDDPEVTAFMKGGRTRVPGNEELDCVHGLLSLSQGNWAR